MGLVLFKIKDNLKKKKIIRGTTCSPSRFHLFIEYKSGNTDEENRRKGGSDENENVSRDGKSPTARARRHGLGGQTSDKMKMSGKKTI